MNVTYLLATGFTKASICSTLLRINKGTGQRKTTWFIWVLIMAVFTSTTVELLIFLIRCDHNGRCQDSGTTTSILVWIVTGVYVLVDIALAVVPVLIIRGLNMKRSLKLSTGAILAVGGIACLAAILRIPAQLDELANAGASDRLYRIGSFILWAELETGLGIIACCLPMLRKLVKSFDTDRSLTTSGGSAHHQPRYAGYSGRTPTHKTQCQRCGSINRADQEEEIGTLSSFCSEGQSLPLQHIHSTNTCAMPHAYTI